MSKPKITWQVPGSDKIHTIPDKAIVIFRNESENKVMGVELRGKRIDYFMTTFDVYVDPLNDEKFELVQ